MAHPLYAVGVEAQTPLLFVITTATSGKIARVRQIQLGGEATGVSPTAKRPIWSRVTAAGTAPTSITPQKLNAFSATSAFHGEYNYGVAPTIGHSSTAYPVSTRNGYGQKVLFPVKSGPIILDSCPLAVQADASNWTWDVNVIFEEF